MITDPPIRISLSPPDVGPYERELLLDAFDSNWIAQLRPHVDDLETEVAAYVSAEHVVALSSETAAPHLALLESGFQSGDEELCSTLTFIATANAIQYVGAESAFVDATREDCNFGVELVAEELKVARNGHRIGAVVAVDLYGRCCDYDALEPVCAEYEVPLIEDAAEALGSRYRGRYAGTLGAMGVFAFNGNKIHTTSGGGMLLTDDDAEEAAHVHHLATQAREPAPHYEDAEVGYNYRMNNLLAAVGRGQLRNLDARIARRREIRRCCEERLGDLPGVAFVADHEHAPSNAWLTVTTIDPQVSGVDRKTVSRHPRECGIEVALVWKPMHLQPAYADHRTLRGEVAAAMFVDGLCLPPGSLLTDEEHEEICSEVPRIVSS